MSSNFSFCSSGRRAAVFSVALAAILSISLLARPAQAQIEYILDSDESEVLLTISASGLTFPQQFAGSRNIAFEGSIFADRTSGIEFLNTTDIDAMEQGTALDPGINGDPNSSAAGDAGVDILLLGFIPIGSAALRDITATLTSSTALTVTSGAFDADGVTLALTGDSALDYYVDIGDGQEGREDLDGESGLNDSGMNGTLTAGSGTETLYLPINLDLQFEFEGYTINVNMAGSLEGTATLSERSLQQVPEPGTWALLGVGLVGLVAAGRRRFRKKA